MSGAESLADPAWDVGCEVWRLRTQGGELIPLSNQLSGAVGGRASSALISIDKASLRAVFRGGRERRRRVRDRGAASAYGRLASMLGRFPTSAPGYSGASFLFLSDASDGVRR